MGRKTKAEVIEHIDNLIRALQGDTEFWKTVSTGVPGAKDIYQERKASNDDRIRIHEQTKKHIEASKEWE